MTLEEIIKNSLAEDIGEGDHTSLACIPANTYGKTQLKIKESGVIAGIELAEMIFKTVDKDIIIKKFKKDGDKVAKGDIAFIAEGNKLSLLKSERVVLNFMQRMSGIATSTNKIVALLEGLNTKVLDTRKTTPCIRLIEKWAVRIGGGYNHRFGLYDMIMIKDNHIDFAGGIKNAILSTNKYLNDLGKSLTIVIEARNIGEVKEIMTIGGIDRIMLDNFTISEMQKAVDYIDKKYETEASGGITLDTIRPVAETGVDYISVGALTHHINSIDMSLKAI